MLVLRGVEKICRRELTLPARLGRQDKSNDARVRLSRCLHIQDLPLRFAACRSLIANCPARDCETTSVPDGKFRSRMLACNSGERIKARFSRRGAGRAPGHGRQSRPQFRRSTALNRPVGDLASAAQFVARERSSFRNVSDARNGHFQSNFRSNQFAFLRNLHYAARHVRNVIIAGVLGAPVSGGIYVSGLASERARLLRLLR